MCVNHLFGCKASCCRGQLGNIAVSGQGRRCNVPVKTYLLYHISSSAPGRISVAAGGDIYYIAVVLNRQRLLWFYIATFRFIFIKSICIVGVFGTTDAFHIKNLQWLFWSSVLLMPVRQGGMNPSGNTFLGRKVINRPDRWIDSFESGNSLK